MITNCQLQVRTSINQSHSIIERSKWGTRQPKSKNLVGDWDFDSIVIHHSGNSGEKSPVGIETKHMADNGWDDVGYHYLIHPNSTIYEGRKIYHKGSHVAGANSRKIGILLMGDYDEQWWDFDDDTLAKSHISTAHSLITTLKSTFPTIRKLGGHKEYLPGGGYSCPGNLVMNVIGKMRAKYGLTTP